MGDTIQRVLTAPLLFDLAVGGIFAGAMFWFYADKASLAESAGKDLVKSIFGEKFFGQQIDYNAKYPWEKGFDFQQSIGLTSTPNPGKGTGGSSGVQAGYIPTEVHNAKNLRKEYPPGYVPKRKDLA